MLILVKKLHEITHMATTTAKHTHTFAFVLTFGPMMMRITRGFWACHSVGNKIWSRISHANKTEHTHTHTSDHEIIKSLGIMWPPHITAQNTLGWQQTWNIGCCSYVGNIRHWEYMALGTSDCKNIGPWEGRTLET